MVLQAGGNTSNTNKTKTGAGQHETHRCVSKEYFDVKEGKPVQIIWNKSSSGEELRGYRLVLNSEIIAYLTKGSLNMTCNEFINDPSLKEFCNKRLEFSSNTSSIILKIRDPSRHENWNFTLKYVLTGPSPCNRLDIKIIRVIPSAVNTESPGGQNMSDNPQIEVTPSVVNTESPGGQGMSDNPQIKVTPSVVNTESPGGQGMSDNPQIKGPGSKIKATLGVTFAAVAAALLLIGGIICWYCKGDARFADEVELANH